MVIASSLAQIQPCLFERLIDFTPEERQESRNQRVLSMIRYREAVIRDIEWLLNSSTHLEKEALGDFPQVERSVLNFGKKDLAGLVVSSMRPADLEEEIARAIRCFEPRIVPGTLNVRCISTEGSKSSRRIKGSGTYNCLTFEITGELWAHPVGEEFFLKTTLDLETGNQAA